jgi:hypothetical protein
MSSAMSRKWLLAFLVAATPAAAHDWYPLECCHEMDCAPVDRTEVIPTPTTADPKSMTPAPSAMKVTTKHGSVLVPANFPRRESKDHRMHACMMPGSNGQMQLICIFMPPSM